MRSHSRALTAFLVALVGILATAATASFADDGRRDRLSNVDGTIWVANRGVHTIQGFDARTGDVVSTVAMAPGSQPGDLAYARGKLYVAEEFGSPPAIAIVDPETGVVTKRIAWRRGRGRITCTRPAGATSSRSGCTGPTTVAVVDTRTDTLLGPWDTNPAATKRPGARRRVLAERADPLRRERRVERDRRARSQDGRHPLEADRSGRARARRDPERQDRVRHPANGEPGLRARPASPRRLHGRAHARSSRHAAPCARRQAADRHAAHDARRGRGRRHADVRARARPDRPAARGHHARRAPVDVTERALHVRGVRGRNESRASRSSTTGTETGSCERSTIRGGRTESTSLGPRTTTTTTAGTTTTRGMR